MLFIKATESKPENKLGLLSLGKANLTSIPSNDYISNVLLNKIINYLFLIFQPKEKQINDNPGIPDTFANDV